MTNLYIEFTKKYWPIFFAHGLVRKTYQMYDAKVYDIKDRSYVDLYYTTRLGIIAIGTFTNMIYWPITVLKDIYSIEAYIRGDTEENKKQLPLEYVFE